MCKVNKTSICTQQVAFGLKFTPDGIGAGNIAYYLLRYLVLQKQITPRVTSPPSLRPPSRRPVA
jgi:hypothetical protein